MKTCHCGALYSHPTSHECSFCAGRVWPCGHARSPEQERCDVESCRKRWRPKRPASAGDGATAKVLTITRKAG